MIDIRRYRRLHSPFGTSSWKVLALQWYIGFTPLVTAALLPHGAASGIEPLYAGILSDHHALYVDFETKLLSGTLTTMSSSAARLLKSTDPNSVDVYMTKLTKQLEHPAFTREKESLCRLFCRFFSRDDAALSAALSITLSLSLTR